MTNCETSDTTSKFIARAKAPLSRSSVDWAPHDYQKRAVKFLLERAVAGLFLDMGLGKTSATLMALKILKSKGLMKRCLIIAPLRVCWSVWPEEQKKWTDFAGLRIEVLHGPKKDEALRRDADIYVMNPDGLEWLSLEKRYKTLNADILVIDESSAFKHAKTLRFKLLKYLIPAFRRRYILTGTPAPNGLIDLFGQIYILDEGAALGRYITHYLSTFFDPAGYAGHDWQLKPGAEEAIYDKIRPMVLRMDAADYLELPERIDNTIYVELPAKARKTYNEIEKLFITFLESGEAITAPSIVAAGIKLRQLANGGIYRNQDKRDGALVFSDEWVGIHDAKLDALEELIEAKQHRPVLVAYEFKHDLDRIRKRFKQAVFMDDYKGAKVEGLVEAWNRGEIEMLCVHPASAGHGLNLQDGKDTIIWFSMQWNLEYEQQLNARILRQGNKSPHVFIHRIVAKNTIDEAVVKALASKDKTQRALLEALKNYSKEVA